MKPNRQASGPDPMEAKALELSQLFAEAGWTASVQNFEPRPFVIWHGAWFSAAGAPPGQSSNAISCRTPEEVIAFLGSFTAPEPREECERLIEAAPAEPTPDPQSDLRARIAELEAALAAKPTEIILEKIVEAKPETDEPSSVPASPEGGEGFPNGERTMIPEKIRVLMNEGETLVAAKRRLTELLYVEKAELENLRGVAGQNLKREAEIEELLSLFARLGEI